MWSNSNIGLQEKGLRISLIEVDWAREVIANTQWAELSYNATVADGFILFVEPYTFWEHHVTGNHMTAKQWIRTVEPR